MSKKYDQMDVFYSNSTIDSQIYINQYLMLFSCKNFSRDKIDEKTSEFNAMRWASLGG